MADIPADTRRLTTQRPQAMADTLLGIITQAATDPRVDIVKMTALLDMQERIMAKAAEAEFNAALANLNNDDLRVAKEGVVKDRDDVVKYRFAKWEDMDAVLRPLMRANGFTLSFNTAPNPNGPGVVITGTLLHQGGHSRTASIPLTVDTGQLRNNLQAMGSTVSYGKRYVTEMLFNIVRQDDDDDGQAGGSPPPRQQPPQRQTSRTEGRVYDVEPETDKPDPGPDVPESAFFAAADAALSAEKNGTKALKLLTTYLDRAPTLADVGQLRGHPFVGYAMRRGDQVAKQKIEEAFKKAANRLAPTWDGNGNGNGNGKHTPEQAIDEAKHVAEALTAEKPDDGEEKEWLPGDS